jgi:hypothetical protein
LTCHGLPGIKLDSEAVAELIAVVDEFNGTYSLADAYQVEPDVIPAPDEYLLLHRMLSTITNSLATNEHESPRIIWLVCGRMVSFHFDLHQ